jgi:hypothetical protein
MSDNIKTTSLCELSDIQLLAGSHVWPIYCTVVNMLVSDTVLPMNFCSTGEF